MVDFRLDPRLLMQQRDPVESFARGFGLVQNLQGKQMLNAQMQRQQEQAQREQQALQQYGQTEDPAVFRGTDPERGLRIKAHLDKLPIQKLENYGKAIDYWNSARGQMIDAPEMYQKTYEQINKLVPEFAPGLQSPEQFKAMNPEQRKQYLYKQDIIAADLKKGLSPYQALMVGYKEKELGLKERKLDIDRTKAEKPEKQSFDEKAYQDELTKRQGLTRLQYLGEKVRAVAEGRQEAKPLSDEEVRRITRYSRKEKSGTISDVERKELKRLKGKQGESVTEPTTYQLPDKTGKMVAVDKKTYDDYQAYWGQQ